MGTSRHPWWACMWMGPPHPSWDFQTRCSSRKGAGVTPEHKFLGDWRTPACPQVGICSSAHPTAALEACFYSPVGAREARGVWLEEANSGSGAGWVWGEWLQPKAALFSHPSAPPPTTAVWKGTWWQLQLAQKPPAKVSEGVRAWYTHVLQVRRCAVRVRGIFFLEE